MNGLAGAVAQRRKLLVLCPIFVAMGIALAADAFAASYRYCDGCTINSQSRRVSNATRVAKTSYMHRLSGPSSGVTIQVQAFWGDHFYCTQQTTTTEAACSVGNHEVHGAAYNGGAGNYGFNAHLSW